MLTITSYQHKLLYLSPRAYPVYSFSIHNAVNIRLSHENISHQLFTIVHDAISFTKANRNTTTVKNDNQIASLC